MADFNVAVEKVLEREGEYVNDPTDSGGETKYGISKRAFPAIEIASLTLQQAHDIYREVYWRFESVASQDVANKLLDMAVNMGLSQAVRLAQNILGVNIDGQFGVKSLWAANHIDADLFLQELRVASAVHYAKIVARDSSQLRFLVGWMRRALA